MGLLGCSLEGCHHMCCFSCPGVNNCKSPCDFYDSYEYGENCEYVFALVKEDKDVSD